MARILAIDATGDIGSIALLEGAELVEEVRLESVKGLAVILFGEIQALLDRRGWPLDSIDCYATASGPGSFTGVRIGLAAAKGLAEAQSKSLVLVSNLEAIAASGGGPVRAVAIDARKGAVYGAVYAEDLCPMAEESVMPLADWLAELPAQVTEVLTPNQAEFGAAIAAAGRQVRPASSVLAAIIGKIAARRLADGKTTNPAAAEANYVRRSNAELSLPPER